MSEEKQKEKGKRKVAHLPGPPQPNSPHHNPRPQPPLVVFPGAASSSLERMPIPAAAACLPGGLPGVLIAPERSRGRLLLFPPLQRHPFFLPRSISPWTESSPKRAA